MSVTLEEIARECNNIVDRIENHATSGTVVEDVGQLDNLHDALANEVVRLALLLRDVVRAQAGETDRPKRGETRGSVHEHAVPEGNAP